MAEIILTPLLQVIFEKLSNPLIEKFAYMWELEDRCKKLQRVLPLVQALLEDADGRQFSDKAVRAWLSYIRDAARKAEDLLDELTYKCKHSKTYSVNILKTRSVLDTLQKAAVEGLNLNLKESSTEKRHSSKRETGSFIIGSEVCGREEDKRRIVSMLLSSSSFSESGSVPVISIIGIPGIGKTTVAQLAYNDEEVRKQFDLRIWVFVSDDFDAKKIIKTAIQSATRKKCKLTDLDALQCELWELLSKKRYLLVLDDVWNDDEYEWDKLRPLFEAGVHGSKIIMTSRSHKVALMMGARSLSYQLRGLPEEVCWDLFRKRAFPGGEEDENHNLMLIGKEIVRKCGGIPSAIKTLGSLMRLKREEREWLYMKDSDLWNLDVYQTGILPALLLSFQHLPSHLKHCFAFCSTFPRNHEINREKVVQMWMAHDLVLSDGGSKQLEDIGADYFDELVWLSFFEAVAEQKVRCASAYKINELFYFLAESAMKNESLKSAMKNESAILENFVPRKSCIQVRHASCVSTYRQSVLPQALFQATYLRTLLVISEGGLQEIPANIFSNFIYLRVLYLSCCQEELPESIEKVRFLRYIDLSNSHFEKLPMAISSIRSLVTLNLSGCYNLKHLPPMDLLTGLRHLNISGCEALAEMPNGIGELVHLQTLPIFIVSPRRKRKHRFFQEGPGFRMKHKTVPISIAALQSLELCGELKIKHLEHVSCSEEAKAANLKGKKRIESLGLCWGYDGAELIMNPAVESNLVRFQERKHQVSGPSQECEVDVPLSDPILATEVLPSLQPHHNLKNLFVVGYPGIKFPKWLLPNLTTVVLIKCGGCLQLPALGHLPFLRTLRMEEISRVTYIGQEFYGEDVAVSFPSLQELFMWDFPLLREWSSLDGTKLFPKLNKLNLRRCPNLISVPLFTSLHHMELQDCNPRILRCMERTTSLSSLVIQGSDDYLPGEVFKNNYLLKYLKISSCPKLQSLPPEFECLTSLKSLTIQWCGELQLIPQGLVSLTALESLVLSDCHNLIALPENAIGGMRSLRTLSIENCSQLTCLSGGLQYLTALEDLTIMYCPSLTSLPNTVEHLSALRSLTLLSCPQIEFLPEGFKSFQMLQSLEIRSCRMLRALPEWIDSFSSLRSMALSECPNVKELPIAVRHLTLLQHLTIQDCPDLQKRCQRDKGSDWWKIAHVPFKHIFSSQQHQSSGIACSST